MQGNEANNACDMWPKQLIAWDVIGGMSPFLSTKEQHAGF